MLERRTADPLLPLRLLRNRGLVMTFAVMFVNQGTLGTGYYVFSSYVQNVRGYSALDAGLAFLPLTIAAMVASARGAAALIARWGTRRTLFTGLLVTAVGMAALTLGLGSFWSMLPGLLIWGIGGGVAFVTQFVAATEGVSPGEQGIVAGVANTFRMVGQAVILAAIVAVATAGLAAHPDQAAIGGGLRAAGWVTAAATLAAAVFTLSLKRAGTPQITTIRTERAVVRRTT